MSNPTVSPSLPRNFNKSSETLAMELIYASTGFKAPVSKVVFGLPQILDPRLDLQNDENTFIPAAFDSAYDARFSSDGGFRYKRLPLSELFHDTSLQPVVPAVPFRTHAVLAQLNALYDAQLEEDDVLDLENTQEGSFTVVASPLSLVWIGYAVLTTRSTEATPANARLLEDGSVRYTEDGNVRTLEGELV